MTPCADLPDPEGFVSNFEELQVFAAMNAGQYRDCATRHNALVGWWTGKKK